MQLSNTTVLVAISDPVCALAFGTLNRDYNIDYQQL